MSGSVVKFIRNKYYYWYYTIINRARKRGGLDGYFEKHHIIPRCMGGSDDWCNIVKLTYREHYLVHWLLIKFTIGEHRTKACHALAMMVQRKPGYGAFKKMPIIPSKWYARSRKAWREAGFSEEHRKRLSIANTGKRWNHTDEAKRKISMAGIGKKRPKETGIRISLSKLGKPRTEETKLKISAANLGRKRSDEAKRRMSESHKGKTHGKMSDETKRKLSIANTGYKHTEEAKKKISMAGKGRKPSDWWRKRMSVVRTGEKRSEEARRNMALAQQRRRLKEVAVGPA